MTCESIAGADNLGNHTATQDLDLSTFERVGNGGTVGVAVSNSGIPTIDALDCTRKPMAVAITLGLTLLASQLVPARFAPIANGGVPSDPCSALVSFRVGWHYSVGSPDTPWNPS